MNNRPCRACKKANMEEVVYSENITVKGVDLHVEGLMKFQCAECGAAIETAAHMDHNGNLVQRAYLAHKTEFKNTHGLLTGEEIRKYRTQVWQITQKQAAAIFGGGPTAFSKYESEDVTQSNAMDKLLRLAAEIPTAFQWLVEKSSNQDTVKELLLEYRQQVNRMRWSSPDPFINIQSSEKIANYIPQPSISKKIQFCANDHDYHETHDYHLEAM